MIEVTVRPMSLVEARLERLIVQCMAPLRMGAALLTGDEPSPCRLDDANVSSVYSTFSRMIG